MPSAGDHVHVLTILSTLNDGEIDCLVFNTLEDLRRHFSDIVIKRGMPYASPAMREELIPALEARDAKEVMRIFQAREREQELPFTFAVHTTVLM